MKNEVIGFDSLIEEYAADEDFFEVWNKCCNYNNTSEYHVREGFMVKGNRLCASKISHREQLIQETHTGSIATLIKLYSLQHTQVGIKLLNS